MPGAGGARRPAPGLWGPVPAAKTFLCHVDTPYRRQGDGYGLST
jgi:hypothetical protein